MPKSKHRRKGQTRERPARTQGNAKHRLFLIPDERDDRIMERCGQLYGPRPDDGYTDEQLIAAERQLEDEDIIPREDHSEPRDVLA